MRFWKILLLGLLAGCTNAPLRVPLKDFDVNIALVPSDRVLFVKQSFDKPPLSLSQVALEGYLTYRQESTTLGFYAADATPCSPTRVGSEELYLCNPNGPGIASLGQVGFSAGAIQRFEFNHNKLTRGINSGELWLGVRLEGGLPTAGTLQFRSLVARVAVLP